MEIIVTPTVFAVEPVTRPQPNGEVFTGAVLLFGDATGTTVRVMLLGTDWEQFKKAVDDPEGFAKSMQARSQIIGPAGLAPTLKNRKH